jgi:hypothetical protein
LRSAVGGSLGGALPSPRAMAQQFKFWDFKEKTMTDNATKIGIAGEYLAAAKLSEMGCVVTITAKNTPGIDLLVSDGKNTKNIQVKATAGGKPEWTCKSPKTADQKLFYIFVILGDTPSFHIATSKEVKDFMERDKVKRIHFKDPEKKHKSKWEKLGLTLQ